MTRTRIDRLTDDERARFNEWADKWIEIGLRTGGADRERMEAAVRDCYRFAGIDWPGVVVWVPSPLVMAFAAPAAAYAIELIEAIRRGRLQPTTAVGGAVDGAVGDAVDVAVGGAVRVAVDGAVRDAVDGAVDGAVGGAVRDAVDGAVGDAVRGAVRGAVGGAVRDAVGGAVDGAVRDAVDGAVRDAVDDAVDVAVRGAVGVAVRGAVGDAVGGAVDVAVRVAVDGAVGVAVRGAVGDAVRGAVGGAVGDADITSAVWSVIRDRWYYYLGGQFWAGTWWRYGAAYTSFFREVCDLALKGDMWDRGRAWEATVESACWWWPYRRFVMICERPTVIHRELTTPGVDRGIGSHRLHCDDGPAVAWPDGWGVYAVHGVRVPVDLIEHGWDVKRILAEPNAEVRRVAIERLGWDRFIDDAALKQVGVTVDDPGNPGQTLALYDVPEQVYDAAVRVLLCANATVERDGSRHRFGLTVPASIKDPVAAAAWTFNLNPSEYRQLERAC